MGLFDFLHKKTSFAGSGLLQGFKDHHSHILFGVDDGVKTLEESLEILSYAESNGVSDMWCTPHIMEEIKTPTLFLQERFAHLKESYKGNISLSSYSYVRIGGIVTVGVFPDTAEKLKENSF